jgi:hypothetical protein
VQSDVLTFLGDRVSESLSGETAQGMVQVFGKDLDSVERTAARIEEAIAAVPGIADVRVGQAGAAATLSVNLLPARLEQYGLPAGDVLDALQTAFAGATVNQVFEKNRAVDVVVLLPASAREHLDSVRALMLRSTGGAFVRLDDIAQIYLATGRAAIRHQGGERYGVVTYNAAERGIAGVSADVRAMVARAVPLPAGTWITHGGEAEAQHAAQRDLVFYSIAALSLIVIVLSAAFRRRRFAIFVMSNLPFSLIGGLFALVVTRQSLTLGALVGLVTVFGISARNAILLLTHLEHLIDREGAGDLTPALIARAAAERLLARTDDRNRHRAGSRTACVWPRQGGKRDRGAACNRGVGRSRDIDGAESRRAADARAARRRIAVRALAEAHRTHRARVGTTPRQDSSSNSAPSCTWSPCAQRTFSTMASAGAVIVCSIFIASSTMSAAPRATRSPAFTSTAMMRPGMGAESPAWRSTPSFTGR